MVRLISEPSNISNAKISNSKDAAKFMSDVWPHEESGICEFGYMLCLNRNHRTVSYSLVSQGGRHGTLMDVSLIAKKALDSLASGVILFHNHPSGNLEASRSDIDLTKKVARGLELLDINLIDHIIVSTGIVNNVYELSHLSMADEGLIN